MVKMFLTHSGLVHCSCGRKLIRVQLVIATKASSLALNSPNTFYGMLFQVELFLDGIIISLMQSHVNERSLYESIAGQTLTTCR
jgi:hypothetical protein